MYKPCCDCVEFTQILTSKGDLYINAVTHRVRAFPHAGGSGNNLETRTLIAIKVLLYIIDHGNFAY
jgi:hypothetical protein